MRVSYSFKARRYMYVNMLDARSMAARAGVEEHSVQVLIFTSGDEFLKLKEPASNIHTSHHVKSKVSRLD
jgi:hypothetical protein